MFSTVRRVIISTESINMHHLRLRVNRTMINANKEKSMDHKVETVEVRLQIPKTMREQMRVASRLDDNRPMNRFAIDAIRDRIQKVLSQEQGYQGSTDQYIGGIR
jgi:hypothetical protein